MTWEWIEPVVHLWEKMYEKGIGLSKKEMKLYESKIERCVSQPKCDVDITPLTG
jgi:hypothetical protein